MPASCRLRHESVTPVTRLRTTPSAPAVVALASCIDRHAGVFERLRGERRLDRYLAAPADRADEEILTEPILESILETVLEFPRDGYFRQLYATP